MQCLNQCMEERDRKKEWQDGKKNVHKYNNTMRRNQNTIRNPQLVELQYLVT